MLHSQMRVFLPLIWSIRRRLRSFSLPMDEIKTESHAELGSIDGEDIRQISKRYGTSADQRDMHRMGKTQKLRVGFLLMYQVSTLTIRFL